MKLIKQMSFEINIFFFKSDWENNLKMLMWHMNEILFTFHFLLKSQTQLIYAHGLHSHNTVPSEVSLTVVLPPASAACETSGALNFSAAATCAC
jgi:hypothetical protein